MEELPSPKSHIHEVELEELFVKLTDVYGHMVVSTALKSARGSGTTCIREVLITESLLPEASVAISFTVYVPATVYTLLGLLNVDVFPFPKSQ